MFLRCGNGHQIRLLSSFATTKPEDQMFNFLSVFPFSLLRGAEEMGLRKAVKPEFGGGTRSFSCEEDYIYENIESELCFFTSQVSQPLSFALSPKHTDIRTQSNVLPPPLRHLPQERQSIIKYWMDNLRAKHGEVLHNINFLEGQPISKRDNLLSVW